MRANCDDKMLMNLIAPIWLFDVGPMALAALFFFGGVTPFFIEFHVSSRRLSLTITKLSKYDTIFQGIAEVRETEAKAAK